MSAREDLKNNIMNENANQLCMTVLGPEGLKDRLLNSFSFMGRMRQLRPIEFTQHDANL